MADDELHAIRTKRLAELQQNKSKTKEEAEARDNEIKNSILSQVLDQKARARLNTIAVAKPEKAKMVENMLVNMARTGQLPGKLGEEDLKNLLEQVTEKTQKKTTVKFDRRRAGLDDDF
uniref:Programmed cell death protein 5 n=1 Tax=Strigamia maritima TaxID=126957 RepID=T1J4Z9_STRMM